MYSRNPGSMKKSQNLKGGKSLNGNGPKASPPPGRKNKAHRSPRARGAHGSQMKTDKSGTEGKKGASSIDSYIEDVLSQEHSVLLMEGKLTKVGRTLNYSIREFPGSYFSINIFVLETHQKWTVYVPITEDMIELLNMWELSPRYRNRSLIGGWLLSCTNLEFAEEVIISANFDHTKLRERCLSELVRFVNSHVVKVQALVRGFITRCKIRVRGNPKNRSNNYYKGNASSLLIGSSLEENSLYSQSSLGSYKRVDRKADDTKKRAKFAPSDSYYQSMNEVQDIYTGNESDADRNRSKVKQTTWDSSTVIRRHGGYRSDGGSLSEADSIGRIRQRNKKRSPKKHKKKQQESGQGFGRTERSYYSEDEDNEMSTYHLESASMLSELLEVRGEISEALDTFRQEMDALRDGIAHQLSIQGSPTASQMQSSPIHQQVSPTSSQFDASQSIQSDEVSILREEMRTMLIEMKQLHQQLNEQRNKEVAALHQHPQDIETIPTPLQITSEPILQVDSEVPLRIKPFDHEPVRLGSYNTTITDVRPLSGIENPNAPETDVRQVTTNYSDLEDIGANEEYERPKLLLQLQDMDFDSENKPHSEILRDIEAAALDPTIDSRLREEVSAELARQALDEQNVPVRETLMKESKHLDMSPSKIQELVDAIKGSHNPALIRECIVTALLVNHEQLAECSALRLMFVASRTVDSGSSSFHFIIDTVLPRFDVAIASMQQFSTNINIVKAYVEIMALVIASTGTDVVVEEYGSTGVCNALMDAIDRFDGDEDMASQILLLCCRLTASSLKNRHRMGIRQNCRIIADLYHRYKSNPPMLTKVTRLLCNICTQAPAILDNMGEGGVCEKLLQCIYQNCDDTKLLNIMSRSALLLCYNNHEMNQRRFATTKGFEVFFHCLHRGLRGSTATFKQICMMIMGVCGSDGVALDNLPVGPLVRLDKEVFALGSGISIDIIKATLTLTCNFVANDTIRAALGQAGLVDSLNRIQVERLDEDLHRMVAMTIRRLQGTTTADKPSTSSQPYRAITPRAHFSRGKSRGNSRQRPVESPMGDYKRPHLVKAQRSVDLDANGMRSAVVLDNIQRAARDPSIAKKLRDSEAKVVAEQKAIDASESLRRSMKEAEDRKGGKLTTSKLASLMNTLETTESPSELKIVLLTAVAATNEPLVEKVVQRILMQFGAALGTSKVDLFVKEFVKFEGLVNAIRMYPDNASVVKCIIEIITLMMVSVESDAILVENLGEAGFCPAVVDCIHLGVDDDDLAMQSVLLGCRVTASNVRNRHRICTLSTCTILGDLFLAFVKSKPILTKLCRLVGNMCVDSPSVLDTIGKAGMCEKVLEALDANKYDRYCLGLLTKNVLIFCDNNHKNIDRFCTPRGFEVMLSCLDSSKDEDPETFREVCLMIMGMFGNSPSSMDLLPPGSTAEKVKKLLAEGQLDDTCLKVFISMIYNFAASPGLKSAFVYSGVLGALDHLKENASDKDVVAAIIMLITRLESKTPKNAAQQAPALFPDLSTGSFKDSPSRSTSRKMISPSPSNNSISKSASKKMMLPPSDQSAMSPSQSKKLLRSSSTTSQKGSKKHLSRQNSSYKQMLESSSDVRSAELLRNIEMAASDPSIEKRLREEETKLVEAQRLKDAAEQKKREKRTAREKQKVQGGSSGASNMTDATYGEIVDRGDDPNALRETLLTFLLVENEEKVKTIIGKIEYLLGHTAGNRAIISHAEIIFGTLEPLMSVMRQFKDNQAVVKSCLGILLIIFRASNNGSDWIEEAGRCGLCDYMLDICKLDAEICEISLKLCRTMMTDSPDNRHRIGTLHNCEVIGDLYLLYRSNIPVISALTSVVHYMCVDSPLILDNLGSSGVCEKLMECMDSNRLDGDIVCVLCKTILLFCYNNHGENRKKFSSARSTEIFMKCLRGSMKLGEGEVFKQMCMMMMGVFATIPDSLHALPAQEIADISRDVLQKNMPLDDSHLKSTLTLIFNFGVNEGIRAAVESRNLQDILIDLQTQSLKGGIPRLALLAFRRVYAIETRGTSRGGTGVGGRPSTSQRSGRTGSAEKSGRALSAAEKEKGSTSEDLQTPTPGSIAAAPKLIAGVEAKEWASKAASDPALSKETPSAPLTEANLKGNETHSPHRPAEPNSSTKPKRIAHKPRKVVDRSYTAISESDAAFKGLPAEQSEVSESQTTELRKLEEDVQVEVQHDEAIRRIQRIGKNFIQRKKNTEGKMSLQFRVAAMLEMGDKIDDLGIIVSAISVAIESGSVPLATKIMQRCNTVIKIAKERKENSPLAVKLIQKAKLVVEFMRTFVENSSIVVLASELITRVSYASGACDSFGKAGIFEVIYNGLNGFSDNAVVVGALLICGVRLTSKKSSNKKRAGTKDGFETIVKIYRAHLDNLTIVDRLTRYTCNCIENFPACQDYFREAGGCEVIADVYTYGPEHLDSIDIISRLIMNLTALNNTDNMKALGTKQTIVKYFDGLAICSLSPKVFKSVAMMICNVFNRAELFMDILPSCDLPKLLTSILDDGNTSGDMDRQEVIFAALMVVQFFASMDALKNIFQSSTLPNTITQFTDKSYSKRVRKAASVVIKRMRGELAGSELSESSIRSNVKADSTA